jgi:hypothetical protein
MRQRRRRRVAAATAGVQYTYNLMRCISYGPELLLPRRLFMARVAGHVKERVQHTHDTHKRITVLLLVVGEAQKLQVMCAWRKCVE